MKISEKHFFLSTVLQIKGIGGDYGKSNYFRHGWCTF